MSPKETWTLRFSAPASATARPGGGAVDDVGPHPAENRIELSATETRYRISLR